VDACLWVGEVGQNGIEAIGDILNGTVNPSGKLVDTYCYDNLTSPAMQNTYVTSYTNAAEHAARTVAMQTATDNGNEILQELTLEYNKNRQQKITSEILDIVGGSLQ